MLKLIYHPNYSCEFPENHRFVMSKFVRLYEVAKREGWVLADSSNVLQPQAASLEDLSIVHDTTYLNGLVGNDIDAKAWRRIGLPWSQGLVDRTLTAPNGTLLAARTALQEGLACHLAGGTHHAHRDFGSGFCMINDLAYAAKTLVANNEVQRILIFDCDVHQGDGTAAILDNDADIFTCSIHCEKNFPFRKSQSDLDVGLDLYLQDKEYIDVVMKTLQDLLETVKPDLVMYDAGVDVWQHDDLGKLDITWQGIHDRDEQVIKTCLLKHIPIMTVIGGGYDKDHQRLAERHSIVVDVAHQLAGQFL